MWRRRERPQVPPPPQLLLIGCWEVPVSGLEEVSFPNSLTLFLVIIGSQVKHHPEQRRLALVFHLQLHLKWGLAQLKKKKNPYFPCFLGQKRNLRCHGEGWPCPGNSLAVVTRAFVVQVSLLFLLITSRRVSHTLVFSVPVRNIFKRILERARWSLRFLPTLRLLDNSWQEVLAFQVNTFLDLFLSVCSLFGSWCHSALWRLPHISRG